MFRRINPVVAACEHSHGAALAGDTMSCGVDAARQSRCDDKALFGEIACQHLREFEAGAGCVARTDNADHRAHFDIVRAADTEQRRRIVDQCEARRITSLTGCQQRDAEPGAGSNFALGFIHGADAPGRPAPPRSASCGRLLKRVAGTAEMIDERAKGARADILAADQPQPVDALCVG